MMNSHFLHSESDNPNIVEEGRCALGKASFVLLKNIESL
jgi:hypothetical protein